MICSCYVHVKFWSRAGQGERPVDNFSQFPECAESTAAITLVADLAAAERVAVDLRLCSPSRRPAHASQPRMAVFTIVATLAYLGACRRRRGRSGPFLSHPPLVALALVTLALAVAALFTRGNLSAGEREDRGNRWVLGAFTLIGLMLGYAPALSDRLDLLVVGGEGTRWVGVLLCVVGGALRIAPVFALGERFSGLVAIQPDHELVTDGLYAAFATPAISAC